ncbi:ferric reductase-like transmembrane domain-containing protein [Amycolatopsis sp. DSM 110486]|uniref:ferredoxin reductase family protein n=1 Tax=Amycolatopsis sp. DSM 110486 TaxID=2865832 RepID=UPI001C6A5EBB|nr:ferredoxin reductase family protein [Amycolatopsis sp. DSM 110486]QYN16580.1 ferredoxin reductase family protein [Amycolatopsis sp. DSM 110486]
MSVLTPIAVPPRPAVAPRVVAKAWIFAFLAANVVLATVFFAVGDLSDDPLISAGRLAGIYAAQAMAVQLLLVARLPWLDRRLGMDRLTSWHRWTGFSLLWLLVAHVVLVVVGYSAIERTNAADELVQLANTTEGILRAIVAFVLILVVGAASARFARKRMAYETWHFVHLYTYAAVVLAFTHQITVGQSFASHPAARVYWWTLWLGAGLAVLAGRVLLPLRRNLRHRLRVVAVVPESPDTVSVYMTGRDLDRLPARAGQFFLWRFLTRDRWWQANPFSLSAAPDGRTLRLTAKAVGSSSASLRSLRVGTRVFAEGPYGAFTTIHQQRPNALLVAGGVGITPIRALLEDVSGHVVLLYRVRTPADAVLLPELHALAKARGAVVHVLSGPSDLHGPHGPVLGPAALHALVPDIGDRDVFVCGPPGMTSAVLRSLRELRVPGTQVHAERFSLAA